MKVNTPVAPAPSPRRSVCAPAGPSCCPADVAMEQTMKPLFSLLSRHANDLAARPRPRPARRRSRLTLETLEDRAVPTASISVAGAALDEIGSPSAFVAAGSGGLTSPKDLTLGPDGNLYVTSNSNSILRYSGTTGQLIGTFVAANSGGLNAPFGLAFGPDGNLYVGSEGTNAIYRYSGTTGAFLNTFVSAGSGGLNVPKGIVFGSDGNLYVSSRDSNSILRYQGPSGPAPGSPLPAAGQPGATLVATASGGLATPHDLVFGPDGTLAVASTGTNAAVLRFDRATGSFLGALVAPGTGGLVNPRGLAFDPEGRLYVADPPSNAVHRYDSQGQYLDDPVVGTGTTLLGPVGITFDAQGALLISSRDTNAVARYAGGVVVTMSATSPTPVTVDYATADGTAVEGSDYPALAGTVTFAPGQTSRRVLLATRDDLIAETNESFTVHLSNPTGGATIAGDTAVVTIIDDDSARQVTISDSTAVEGDQAGHYRGPLVSGTKGGFQPITFGPDGRLYVGDGGNRIRRYDAVTGDLIDTFATSTSLVGTRDIRFQGGYLYVGSEYTDEVLRFDATTGAFDRVFVTAGSGGIDAPHGMAFGPDVNGDHVLELYVTGRNSNNVVRYDGATGQPLGIFITPGSGGLSVPEGLTFDPAGNFAFVTSSATGRILKYNALTGAYLEAVTL
ncbi:MAG: NHL repeat-containing protein [Gemmataceae bacterium]